MKLNKSGTHGYTYKMRGTNDGWNLEAKAAINPRKVMVIERQPVNAKTGRTWQATKTVAQFEMNQCWAALKLYNQLLQG